MKITNFSSCLLVLILTFATTSVKAQGIEITNNSSPGSISISGNATISISNGSFMNNGVFMKSTETISFIGNSAALISGTSETEFYDLNISNSGGVISELSLLTVNNATISSNSSLKISSKGSLTVLGSLSSNGTITLQGDLANTGSLINSTSGVTVNVERFVNDADWLNWKDGWHFLSSPVSNQVISNGFTTGEYDFYCWKESTNTWVNYKDGSFSGENGANFIVGKGYMAAYNSEATKVFSGIMNFSDVAFDNLEITSSSAYKSWHLLGNPFASALLWSNSWERNNVNATLKIWNEANQSYSDINFGDVIPATNGFMIQAVGATGTVTIPSNARVHNSQGHYKSVEQMTKLRFIAHDLEAGNAQESNVLVNVESTPGYDMICDGEFLAGYGPAFYSVSDGEKLSTNSIPALTPDLEVPFTFIPNQGSSYSIELIGNEQYQYTPYLLDRKTGIDQNLSANPLYTFSSVQSDISDRFRLHFKPLGVEETEADARFGIYTIENSVVVKSFCELDGDVTIVDLSGRILVNGKIIAGEKSEFGINEARGVFVVRISTAEGTYAKKIVIQ